MTGRPVRAAACFRRNSPPAVIAGIVNVADAFPIKVGDVTIGALAVSGAPVSAQDATCASAVLAKLSDQLK